MNYFIGVMSGTSLDGIDVAIIDYSDSYFQFISAKTYPFSSDLKYQLQKLVDDPHCHLVDFGQTDISLGKAIAESVNDLLNSSQINPKDVQAIGSHGQTIFHQPDGTNRFSLQIGNPNVIVELTGITTIADFRQRDIVMGGQGAPLVPAFHQSLFKGQDNRVVINIGGISNITILPTQSSEDQVIGFDTGPGNTLMDAWCLKHTQQAFDKGGQWAQSGQINPKLLDALLDDDYFALAIPKSTGRQYFNLHWLQQKSAMIEGKINAHDVQATLCKLTAVSITNDIKKYAADIEHAFVCGGGVHNPLLLKMLADELEHCEVTTTEPLGIHPDWVEACAFAWLAKQTLNHMPGNLPEVTGASHATLLGGVYSSKDAS